MKVNRKVTLSVVIAGFIGLSFFNYHRISKNESAKEHQANFERYQKSQTETAASKSP